MMVREALGRTLTMVLILVLAIALVLAFLYWVLIQEDPVEFGSMQDVADDITGFYSVALDRVDIKEGEFELGIKPGGLISVELEGLPEITERTVEGERQVTFSSDGTRLSVQTTEDRHFVDVYPESFFGSQNTTSVLRVHLGDGKEVEVPVNIGIMQSLTRQTPDTAEGQALLELDPDATHQYVLRVNQIQNRMLFSERFVRIFTGIGDESMVPFGSLRGMDQTLNDVPSEIAWYHNLILDHAVLAKYNELVDQDELGEDIRKYCEVDIHRSTNWCEPSDNDSGALTERIFDLSDEARNFVEEASFADQKQYLSEEDVQKMEQLQVLDEMSEEELLQALGETVVFVAPVELVSIDGINISSN